MNLYHGNVVYSKTKEELAECPNSYIAVEDGVVEGIYGFIAEYHVHRSGCTAWAWVNAEQDHWF